jgi:predicted transcriptional regulator
LELSNVIPDEKVARNKVNDAVAELPAGLLKTAIGVTTDDAIHGKSAFLLKGSNRTIDDVIEHSACVIEESDVNESRPHLGNRRADVTAAQVHYR